jgi:hypothetical protein
MKRNAYKNSGGKSERKRPLWRPGEGGLNIQVP